MFCEGISEKEYAIPMSLAYRVGIINPWVDLGVCKGDGRVSLTPSSSWPGAQVKKRGGPTQG